MPIIMNENPPRAVSNKSKELVEEPNLTRISKTSLKFLSNKESPVSEIACETLNAVVPSVGNAKGAKNPIIKKTDPLIKKKIVIPKNIWSSGFFVRFFVFLSLLIIFYLFRKWL